MVVCGYPIAFITDREFSAQNDGTVLFMAYETRDVDDSSGEDKFSMYHLSPQGSQSLVFREGLMKSISSWSSGRDARLRLIRDN
jgi:hypothetical protein